MTGGSWDSSMSQLVWFLERILPPLEFLGEIMRLYLSIAWGRTALLNGRSEFNLRAYEGKDNGVWVRFCGRFVANTVCLLRELFNWNWKRGFLNLFFVDSIIPRYLNLVGSRFFELIIKLLSSGSCCFYRSDSLVTGSFIIASVLWFLNSYLHRFGSAVYIDLLHCLFLCQGI